MPSSSEQLERSIEAWLADPDSDVVHAEPVEGRWAVRMRQTVRDATTVWWEVGQRTVALEAYVLPPTREGAEEVYRLCLARNNDTWRVRWALDREGAVLLRARLAGGEVSHEVLDAVLGEVYQQVEVTFPALVRLAFGGRENSP